MAGSDPIVDLTFLNGHHRVAGVINDSGALSVTWESGDGTRWTGHFEGDGLMGATGVTRIVALPGNADYIVVADGTLFRVDTAFAVTQPFPTGDLRQLVVNPDPAAVLLAGFTTVVAFTEKASWQSPRLAWDDVAIRNVRDGLVTVEGFDAPADAIDIVRVDLWSGQIVGPGIYT